MKTTYKNSGDNIEFWCAYDASIFAGCGELAPNGSVSLETDDLIIYTSSADLIADYNKTEYSKTHELNF